MPNKLNVPGDYFSRADLLFHAGSNRLGINQNLGEISLIHNMQASKDESTSEAPPHLLSIVSGTFSPKHFLNRSCKYSVQLRLMALVLCPKCIAQSQVCASGK